MVICLNPTVIGFVLYAEEKDRKYLSSSDARSSEGLPPPAGPNAASNSSSRDHPRVAIPVQAHTPSFPPTLATGASGGLSDAAAIMSEEMSRSFSPYRVQTPASSSSVFNPAGAVVPRRGTFSRPRPRVFDVFVPASQRGRPKLGDTAMCRPLRVLRSLLEVHPVTSGAN